MKILYALIAFIAVSSFFVQIYQYFNKKTVSHNYLTRFEGKWAATKEQVFFAKTSNGLSVSLYRSPTETMEIEGNYVKVKNWDSFEYVENAGGLMNYREGGFYFDFFISEKEKLPFRFDTKTTNGLIFRHQNEAGKYVLIVRTIEDKCIIDVSLNQKTLYHFSGIKMRY